MGFDYYEVLGVEPSADKTTIAAAYRRLARASHPDAGGSGALFSMVNEAYVTLSDPVRRAEYDQTRKGPQTGGHASASGSRDDEEARQREARERETREREAREREAREREARERAQREQSSRETSAAGQNRREAGGPVTWQQIWPPLYEEWTPSAGGDTPLWDLVKWWLTLAGYVAAVWLTLLAIGSLG